jgi:mono/diheme cytochrome c family protein
MSDRKALFRLRSLPPVALALAATGFGGAAVAQVGNPTTGATLYAQAVPIPGGVPLSCANCHGPANLFKASRAATLTNEMTILARINGFIASNTGGMGAYSAWTQQQRADVAAYINTAAAAPPPPPLTLPPGTPAPPPPAPAPAPAPAPVPPTTSPTATPNPALFSSTTVGKESATSGVLVTNSTRNTITFASPALVPPAGTTTEFLVVPAPAGSTNCIPSTSLEPGQSCSFGVNFAPLAVGTRSEKWTINFTNNVPSREVMLEGTAIASTAAVTGTAPTGSSAANAPTDGGGGALGWISLLGLGGFAALAQRRRRAG